MITEPPVTAVNTSPVVAPACVYVSADGYVP